LTARANEARRYVAQQLLAQADALFTSGRAATALEMTLLAREHFMATQTPDGLRAADDLLLDQSLYVPAALIASIIHARPAGANAIDLSDAGSLPSNDTGANLDASQKDLVQ